MEDYLPRLMPPLYLPVPCQCLPSWPGRRVTKRTKKVNPRPRKLVHMVRRRTLKAKTGPAYLKAWGSTDSTKRRHGRIACLEPHGS